MANHPHLLGDDVELLAGLNADLLQRQSVMRTHAFGLGQFMAHHMARQGWVQWFAPTLGAFVGWNINAFVLGVFFLRCRLGLHTQDLGLIEEHVLLALAAGFALGGKDLAHEFVQALFEQVTFGAHQHQFAFE